MVDCDVAIIGGGPGGYVAAIRAGQLGRLEEGLVELGGRLLTTMVRLDVVRGRPHRLPRGVQDRHE